MKSLSMRNRCVIGFTLFSMFFGAGNLIFPPLLGAEAGISTIPAMVGMLLTAVVLPALAVISVAKHDGLKNLAGKHTPGICDSLCGADPFVNRTICCNSKDSIYQF